MSGIARSHSVILHSVIKTYYEKFYRRFFVSQHCLNDNMFTCIHDMLYTIHFAIKQDCKNI